MKKVVAFLIIVILAPLVAAQNNSPQGEPAGQPPAATAPAPTSQLQPGSLVYAELTKSIDSKKAKVGDPVVAKVTQGVLSHGKIVIPKNTKMVGHLTAVQAHTKDQPQSQLGIVFDHAELKGGSQVPLTSATIQALASMMSLDQPNMANGTAGADTSGMPSSRPGGNMGGVNAPMGGAPYPSNPGTGSADSTTGTGTMPATGSPHLNANSRGVMGMPGVRLEPQAQGGRVSVDGKNVKLESGTQVVLRVP